MRAHVPADSNLTAEHVEKANSRLSRGMMSGGKLYQRRCGGVQHAPSAFICVDLLESVVCVCGSSV
jgi:hypothetical protein